MSRFGYSWFTLELLPWNFMTFHINWESYIIPTDELTPSFFRGVGLLNHQPVTVICQIDWTLRNLRNLPFWRFWSDRPSVCFLLPCHVIFHGSTAMAGNGWSPLIRWGPWVWKSTHITNIQMLLHEKSRYTMIYLYVGLIGCCLSMKFQFVIYVYSEFFYYFPCHGIWLWFHCSRPPQRLDAFQGGE